MADEPELPNDADLLKMLEPEPAPAEPPAPEPPLEEPAPPPVEAPKEPPAPKDEATVPSWRLREESEARRAADDRARQLEARLTEIETRQRQQQQPPKTDFYEDPERSVTEIAVRTLRPFIERAQQTTMVMSKVLADREHTKEVVEEASTAFMNAHKAGQLSNAEFEDVVESPHRFESVVQWYKRRGTLSTVGSDPEAYFDKRLDELLAKPDFQKKLAEKLRGTAESSPGVVKLPPSLSKAGKAAEANEDLGDLSDESIWDTVRGSPRH